MATQERERGCVIAVAGAPQSGKSTWMRHQVAKHARVLVFGDWRGEYQAAGFTPIKGPRELITTLKGHKGAGRYTYRGGLQDFDTWCLVGLAWVQYFPATLLIDELAGPTNPGKAPRHYGEILRMIAGYGGYAYGCTQRISESDTTIWGVADLLHVHRMVRTGDAEKAARELNCTPQDLLQLPDFEYLEREAKSAQFTRGRVEK